MSRYIISLLLGLLLSMTINYKGYTQSKNDFSLFYFEDVDSKYSLESVKHKKFIEAEKTYVNLGITKSTLWLKVKLNPQKLDPYVVLKIKSPFKDSITISYVLKNKKLVEETIDINYAKNKLNHYYPTFEIPIKDLDSPVLYLKLKSRWTMFVPIEIVSKDYFNKQRVDEYLVGGIFIGGMLIITIFNLLLFFSLRDKNYLIYVGVLVFTLFSQGYVSGFFIPYISSQSPEFTFRFLLYSISLSTIFTAYFTIHFLELKKKDGFFYYGLVVIIILSVLNMLLELLNLYYLSRQLSLLLVLTNTLIIFISSIYSYVKKNINAKFFIIAWSFYLLGLVVYQLKVMNVLDETFLTKYAMYIGVLLEVVLMSFALGHKYKLVQKEKEQLERQTRNELEMMVSQQTLKISSSLKEKEILLQEIHHRVKNNLQIVISLLDLQVASIKNRQDKEALLQSKSRIYSMSLIHQKLYQSDNLASVNIKNYLEELFVYIQNSYSHINNKITFISLIDDKELALTQAVPLGLIVNELLTNSFKYGLLNKEKNTLKMSLVFNEDNIVLEIADSGLGFDEKQQQGVKNSLGLFLIKSLSKQLRATTVRYFDNALFITKITIPIKKHINNK